MTSASATRRLSVATLTFVIASFSLLVLVDTASSQTPEFFRDDFTSISYSGNNGSMNWSGSWQESGESNGASTGSVQVTASDRCLGGSGNCLGIGSDGGNLANHGVSRAANLDDAESATLSFHYRRQTQGQVSGSVTVQVSGNGGSSWATLTTINFAGPQKASSATFNIGGYMGPNTKVRFRGTGTGVDGYLHIDAIEITADIAAATPTTTPTVVTTTVPGTPTTTTNPGTPSTSTIPGTPTTTTLPGTPTTTTLAGAPTSTLAGLPTTTTVPGASTTTTPGTSTTSGSGSPTTSSATSNSAGMAPPTTSPTGSDTTLPDAPFQATKGATQAASEPPAVASAGDDLAPMAIAVETVSANAVTIVILALLASGLAFAGIDRAKPEPTPDTDADVNAELPPSDQ